MRARIRSISARLRLLDLPGFCSASLACRVMISPALPLGVRQLGAVLVKNLLGLMTGLFPPR